MEPTKRCVTCKLVLPLTAFNKRQRSKDGLQFRCRECYRQWHAANKERHNKQIHARSRRARRENYERMRQYLAEHPCVDCGETDPTVLEFDHLGDKWMNVAQIVRNSYPWSTVLREIAKCEVVCANCHRRRTYYRMGSRRTAWAKLWAAGASIPAP
jgi:hypothetical protein